MILFVSYSNQILKVWFAKDYCRKNSSVTCSQILSPKMSSLIGLPEIQRQRVKLYLKTRPSKYHNFNLTIKISKSCAPRKICQVYPRLETKALTGYSFLFTYNLPVFTDLTFTNDLSYLTLSGLPLTIKIRNIFSLPLFRQDLNYLFSRILH